MKILANKSIGRRIRSSLEMNDPLLFKEDVRTNLPDNFEQSNKFPDLSIIIPVYNEEKTIRSTINMIKKVVVHFNLSYEFLIINDGSTDSTRLEIENSGIEFINLKQNRGVSRGRYRFPRISKKVRIILYTLAIYMLLLYTPYR